MRAPPPAIADRLYVNLQPRPCRSGMMVMPAGDRLYWPRIDHACFRERPSPDVWRKEPHAHDVYHVVLMTAGTGTILLEGREVPAQAGDLFLVGPGQPHSFLNTRGEDKEYSVVAFEWLDDTAAALDWPFERMLSAWAGRELTRPTPVVPAPGPRDRLGEHLGLLAAAGLSGGAVAEVDMIARLWRVLRQTCDLLIDRADRPMESDAVSRVEQRLRQAYAEPVRLAELARIAHLTPNYLCTAFRRRYGRSIVQYQHALRIQAARALLEGTGYPIKHIAERVGFEDVYYFSRVFGRLAGLPPGAYRARWRRRDEPPGGRP